MSTGITPVGDPVDVQRRNDLVADWAHRRKEAGLSRADVARFLGQGRTAPGQFEDRRPADPHITLLIKYGSALGLKPVIVLRGVAYPRTPAPDALLAGGFVGAAAVAELNAARVHLGLTRAGVARSSRIAKVVLFRLEDDRHEPRLSTLQRYARALGGWIETRWEPC